MTDSLVRQPFATIRRLLDARELRAVELTRLYLERISGGDYLGAYVTVDSAGALEAAEVADRELDAGIHRGPLHGIPIGVKDNIAVAGLPMRAGSWTFENYVPAADAAVVAAARAAGAIILGKQSMHEVGLGDPVRDGLLRTGVHPWNGDYLPGGSSSGGAVAAAAGLCMLALGTDTGGSVRNPAASCGVIGFKPTYGRVDARGVLPLCWSLDTVGFLSRDLDAVEAGLAGLGYGVPAGELSHPPRLLYLSEEAVGEVAPEVLAAYSESLETWGAAGARLDATPPLSFDAAGPVWQARLAETYQVHFAHLLADPSRYSPSMRGVFEQGAAVDAATYGASWEAQGRLIAEFENALAGYDALLLPANPRPALRWGAWEGLNVFEWYRFSWPFNVTRQPAITIPCTLSPEGLPIAYQLVGRRGEDEHLLRVARWSLHERPFGAEVPPLSGDSP